MSTIDQQFVEYIVKTLVNNPDKVSIDRTIDEKGVLLSLEVDPEDVGRIIGKRGATETAKQTAVREIGEESGLKNVDVLAWLGKIHFKYRRLDKLVLMTTQVYLVQSLDKNERPTKEKWMNGIRWFSFSEALDAIEYADIEKLMLIAKKKIRSGDY